MLVMITAGIFQTVEFYVVVSVIAAFVVAFMALPGRKGEVKSHLISGQLLSAAGDEDVPTGPGCGSLTFECHEGGIVSLRRDGLHGVAMSGAVSLVVKVSGFDVVIEERVSAGSHPSFGEATAAVFFLDFLAPEWYHVRYESERTGEFAALTLHVREGIVVNKRLTH